MEKKKKNKKVKHYGLFIIHNELDVVE